MYQQQGMMPQQQMQQQQYQQPMQQGGMPQQQYQQPMPQHQQYQQPMQQGGMPQQQYQQPMQQQAPQAAPDNGNSVMVQGRIVWSIGKTLFQGKGKVNDKGQPVLNEQNQQVIEYGFGLAIPKNTQMHQTIMQALQQAALSIFPSGQFPPAFAWKYKDGDGVDHTGQPFANREGHAGHIILACTTQIPIKFYAFQGGNNMQVNDGIKVGDYVNVALNIKGHPAKGQGKPGVYTNPTAVQLITPGKEIINTPSGDQMFGMQAPTYQGQVVAPEAAPLMNLNAMNQQPPVQQQYQQPMQQGGMPQQQTPYQQQPVQQQNYAPNYNVLPPNMQPQQQQFPNGGAAGAPNNFGQQVPGMTPAQGAPHFNGR